RVVSSPARPRETTGHRSPPLKHFMAIGRPQATTGRARLLPSRLCQPARQEPRPPGGGVGYCVASLHADVPVDAPVVRLPAHGHQVDAAVAVEVGRRQVLDRDAATFDDLASPLRALLVLGLVDADAAPL